MLKILSFTLLSIFLLSCDKKEEVISIESEGGVIQVTDGVEITGKDGVKIKGSQGSFVMEDGKLEIKGTDGKQLDLYKVLKTAPQKGDKIKKDLDLQLQHVIKGDATKSTKSCSKGDCKQVCAGPLCSFSCSGGDCPQTCKDDTFCSFTCSGGNCKQACAKGASCTFTCSGGNCLQAKNRAKKFVSTCSGGNCKK